MNKRYRGYIGSRMSNGRSVPQHIQQMVIRDYCQRNGLTFMLSATEYCMDRCTMMLDAILAEDNDGIVAYSMFLLPCRTFSKPVHCAAENYIINGENFKELCKIGDICAGNDILTRLSKFY